MEAALPRPISEVVVVLLAGYGESSIRIAAVKYHAVSNKRHMRGGPAGLLHHRSVALLAFSVERLRGTPYCSGRNGRLRCAGAIAVPPAVDLAP